MDVKKWIVEFVAEEGQCVVGRPIIERHFPEPEKLFEFCAQNRLDYLIDADSRHTFLRDDYEL